MITAEITKLHKNKIKEMVDELIINHGILKIDKEAIALESPYSEDMINQAFKYYRMIIRGESPLDIDLTPPHSGRCAKTKRKSPTDHCIGCDRSLTKQDISISMPVCADCRQKIKVDYEVLREILQ